MANNNTKKKTNTNNKNNTKGSTTKKVTASKNTSTNKNTKTNNNSKSVNNTKKEVKKVVTTEEVKVEKIPAEKVEVKKEKKSFKLTSKQRDFILVVLVIVILIIALALTGSKEPKLNIELPIALEGTAGFNEITYSEYEEKLNTEAPFVVIIVRDGCGYCEMYEPIVEKVANEYNLPINYINLTHLTTEERNALSTSNSYLKKTQWGTPTTLFMYGKTVVDSIGQYVDEDTFTEFVKKNFVVE